MGWKRAGLLNPVYAQLAAEGFSDARDELARRTKIPPTNLSGINAGKREMTTGYARRVAAAVGISPVELGAPAAPDDQVALSFLDRLKELEAGMNRLGPALTSLADRVAVLERQAPPKTGKGGSQGDRP